MHSLIVAPILAAAGLASFVQAYTPPGAQTWGPLLTPDTSDPVTQGQTALVTWDPESHPTDGVTVSLVLCHGPSTNCVDSPTAIASGIPAAQKSFSWDVPCDLAPGTQNTDTGYGMLIIVDGTGEFQFSTQFSVLANPSCSSGSSSSSSSSSSSLSSSASVASSTSKSAGSSSAVVSSTSSASSGPSSSGNRSQTSSGANSWGSASTTTTASAGASVTGSGSGATSTWNAASNTAPGVVALSSTTYTVFPSGTTMATSASATKTSSAPASTFTGGAAPQVGLSGAGLVIAGAFAVLAL